MLPEFYQPIPNREVISSIDSKQFPKHQVFLKTVETISGLLQSVGIPPEEAMVISGGSVALRQMSLGRDERIPTDTDLVLRYKDGQDAHNILNRVALELQKAPEFRNTQLITKPRTHWGFRFTNPIIESLYVGDGYDAFPIDIMTEMVTVFPDKSPAPLLSGVAYDFPNYNPRLFELSQPIQVGTDRIIRVASPAFVLFYKLTMNRNGENGNHPGHPKQDDLDLKWMWEMGLINLDNPEFEEVFKIMSQDNLEIEEQLLQFLQLKIDKLTKAI